MNGIRKNELISKIIGNECDKFQDKCVSPMQNLVFITLILVVSLFFRSHALQHVDDTVTTEEEGYRSRGEGQHQSGVLGVEEGSW